MDSLTRIVMAVTACAHGAQTSRRDAALLPVHVDGDRTSRGDD
jgi:hypothetical protein